MDDSDDATFDDAQKELNVVDRDALLRPDHVQNGRLVALQESERGNGRNELLKMVPEAARANLNRFSMPQSISRKSVSHSACRASAFTTWRREKVKIYRHRRR